jgi:putative transcriptional regulator
VILLIHVDQQGAVGVMLNRPANIRLDEVFPGTGRKERIYAGGPVALGYMALVRGRVEQGKQLLAGVWVVSGKRLVERAVAAYKGEMRVYLGNCGWTKQQLLNEVGTGLWHVHEGNAERVFDRDPETLWQRLMRTASP